MAQRELEVKMEEGVFIIYLDFLRRNLTSAGKFLIWIDQSKNTPNYGLLVNNTSLSIFVNCPFIIYYIYL